MAKTGRNAPCPCGSGKKYKHCCLRRHVAIRSRAQQRRERARRPKTPHRVPRLRTSDGLLAEIQSTGEVSGYAQPFVIDAMRKAGLRPEYIHAYERVGHLITKSNRAVIPTEIVEAWDAAVEEYKQEHSEESTNG